ncbi:MAG: AAA family ATPase [Chitinophagales bacterium]|nr:AAA family ATPase [Chitinophagales bacterium]
MPVIYIDNFRGFKSTYLPLRPVNFFVGENSTGKTSLLKLLGIISSQGFWRYKEFGLIEDGTFLGGYSEIASEEKSYFEIGMLEDATDDGTSFSAIKLRFINNDNYPTLKEISFKNDIVSIQVILEGSILKYRYNIEKDQLQKKEDIEFFKSWIENSNLNDLNFERIEIESGGILPILNQLESVVTNSLNETQKADIDIKSIKITRPSFLRTLAWMAPVRAEPRKVYEFRGLIFNPEGGHIPSVLKEILPHEDTRKILNRFGHDSGLYEEINIKELSNDTFEILIKIKSKLHNIMNVGYGISQILPLLIEAIARPNNSWFAMQQPEIHLHPKAQAAFGDFIYKSNDLENQKFIIETHSDYIIDRFRLRINRAFKEEKSSAESISQVVFFSKSENRNELITIPIQENGSYPENQPDAFRDFFINEQLNLLSI